VLLSVSNDNIMNIDVDVVINDYHHHHLREEGCGVFIKELHMVVEWTSTGWWKFLLAVMSHQM